MDCVIWEERTVEMVKKGKIVKEREDIKVCFAASSGGHFEQLSMLRPMMETYDSFIITEETDYNALKSSMEKVYYMRQVNRKEHMVLFCMMINFFRSCRIFHKEKPDVVVCTGVLAMIPICLIAKLMRKKLIYIESFAKVTTPTETGRLMYRIADQFYVQWESMLEVYPNAIYLGGIY